MSENTTWIVLFRGVGGKTQLPVKPLRGKLTEAGFRDVATYINSGNAVVTTDMSREAAKTEIAAICSREFGFDKDIHLRSAAEWESAIAGNPFPLAAAKPTTLHLFTLDEEPDAGAVSTLREKATGTERFAVKGRVLYLHAPDGLGNSKFAPKIETVLKVSMTARNWNTVLKLAELAGATA